MLKENEKSNKYPESGPWFGSAPNIEWVLYWLIHPSTKFLGNPSSSFWGILLTNKQEKQKYKPTNKQTDRKR